MVAIDPKALESMSAKDLKFFLNVLENSHGGYAGMTIVQQLTRDLDEAYANWKSPDCEELQFAQGLMEGIAHALGVMRNSSCDHECDKAEERWKARHPNGS